MPPIRFVTGVIEDGDGGGGGAAGAAEVQHEVADPALPGVEQVQPRLAPVQQLRRGGVVQVSGRRDDDRDDRIDGSGGGWGAGLWCGRSLVWRSLVWRTREGETSVSPCLAIKDVLRAAARLSARSGGRWRRSPSRGRRARVSWRCRSASTRARGPPGGPTGSGGRLRGRRRQRRCLRRCLRRCRVHRSPSAVAPLIVGPTPEDSRSGDQACPGGLAEWSWLTTHPASPDTRCLPTQTSGPRSSSRSAPRGYPILKLESVGREDEPSPLIRPWPAARSRTRSTPCTLP